MAFGDAFAAAHVGMTFRGTILGYDGVDDAGSRFWNVRYDDGEYPIKEQDMTIVAAGIEQLQEEEEEEEGGSLPESEAVIPGVQINQWSVSSGDAPCRCGDGRDVLVSLLCVLCGVGPPAPTCGSFGHHWSGCRDVQFLFTRRP